MNYVSRLICDLVSSTLVDLKVVKINGGFSNGKKIVLLAYPRESNLFLLVIVFLSIFKNFKSFIGIRQIIYI